MSEDVCRLCLSSEELIWIFDERMSDNMKDIIHATSGVEIMESDWVTQKVCITCCQITIRMYKFRTAALKNDKELKTRMQKFKKKIVDDVRKGEPTKKRAKSTHHPSVQKLKTTYPNIKLPQNLPLGAHFEPYITLITDEVDVWYKERNYSDAEIIKLKSVVVGGRTVKRTPICGPKSKVIQKPNIVDVNQTTKEILKDLQASLNRIQTSDVSPSVSEIISQSVSIIPVREKDKNDEKTVSPLVIKFNKEALGTVDKKSHVVRKALPDVRHENITITDILKSNDVSKKTDKKPRNLSVLSDGQSNIQDKTDVDDDELIPLSKKRKTTRICSDTDENDSDPETLSRAPSNCSSSTASSNATEVTGFLAEGNGQTYDSLNSSLWSSTSSTVYACKICNQVYHSLKYLKHHENVRHTKCPFCGKKFRTIALKEEHIKTSCTIYSTPVECKDLRICLEKVDEIDEIRNHYASAFNSGCPVDKNIEKAVNAQPLTVIEPQKVPENQANEAETPRDEVGNDLDDSDDHRLIIVDPQEDEPIKDKLTQETTEVINKPLDNSKNNSQLVNEVVSKEPSQCETISSDVICISDDENSTTDPGPTKPIIKIKQSNVLRGINYDDCASKVLKELLTRAYNAEASGQETEPNIEPIPNNTTVIVGNGRKTLTLKNLRNHLYTYKIPVNIQYGNKLKVVYDYTNVRDDSRRMDNWKDCPCRDIVNYIPASKSTVVHPVGKQIVNDHQQIQVAASQAICNTTTSTGSQLQSAQPMQILNSMLPVSNQNVSGTSHSLLFGTLAASANVAGYPVLVSATQNTTSNVTQNTYANYYIVPHGIIGNPTTLNQSINPTTDHDYNKSTQSLQTPNSIALAFQQSINTYTHPSVLSLPVIESVRTNTTPSKTKMTVANPIASTSKVGNFSGVTDSGNRTATSTTSEAPPRTIPTSSIWVKNIKDLMM